MSRYPQLSRREFLRVAPLAIAAPALAFGSAARARDRIVVETSAGRLRGSRVNGAFSFRGVAYAADTGGANRFLPPRPVPAWTGVRDALQLGDRCPQVPESIAQEFPVFSWYDQSGAFSENCCVLNVYTPGPDVGAKRPVMFYIHGGGFRSGGGGGPALDGINLAKFGDVVVVTVNHRLNGFGFTNLAHLDPEHFGDSSNVGMLDLVAALRWVRDNIALFGGDPGNVTIFGQSGGGSKCQVLLAMPTAHGLFHRMINMSGISAFGLVGVADSESRTNELLKVLGIEPRDAAKLQSVPADALMIARAAASKGSRDSPRPSIDGRNLPAPVLSSQGLAVNATVPVMMGTTDTEATYYLRNEPRNFAVEEYELRRRVEAQFGMEAATANTLIAAYREDAPRRTATDVLAALASDMLIRGPILRAAEIRSKAGVAPTYVYNFGWHIPVDGGKWRSPHTVDIPFAFGNIDRATMMTGGAADAVEVSRAVMRAFIAFARRGDPNGPSLPEWKPYEADTRPTMLFDVEARAVSDYHSADRRASLPLPGGDTEQLQRGPLFVYSKG